MSPLPTGKTWYLNPFLAAGTPRSRASPGPSTTTQVLQNERHLNPSVDDIDQEFGLQTALRFLLSTVVSNRTR